MRIIVPITGELIGAESGNPDNPITPINFRKLVPKELNNFSWQAIDYDFEKGTVELEVTVEKRKKQIVFPTDRELVHADFRPETTEEFNQRKTDTEYALSNLAARTVNELHQMTGEPKLILKR